VGGVFGLGFWIEVNPVFDPGCVYISFRT